MNQSGCYTVEGVKDAEEFKHTKNGMSVVGISDHEQQEAFKLLAGILHVGNLTFRAKGRKIPRKIRDEKSKKNPE